MGRLRKGCFAAIGVAALGISTLALAAPAGAGLDKYPPEEAWPTLRVEKTIGEANDNGDEVDFPEGTEFTVKVTCAAPREKNLGFEAANGYYPTFVTFLTFDEDGNPESADPSDGWFKDGDAWALQGKPLAHKLCTAEETDIESDDNGDSGVNVVNEDDVEVAYKCEATAQKLDVVDSISEQSQYDLTFGCVRPLPEGEYDDDAEDAAVQFTSPWDRDACRRAPGLGEQQTQECWCQETGTLTVDNTWDPPEPEVVTPAPAPILTVSPTFTG